MPSPIRLAVPVLAASIVAPCALAQQSFPNNLLLNPASGPVSIELRPGATPALSITGNVPATNSGTAVFKIEQTSGLWQWQVENGAGNDRVVVELNDNHQMRLFSRTQGVAASPSPTIVLDPGANAITISGHTVLTSGNASTYCVVSSPYGVDLGWSAGLRMGGGSVSNRSIAVGPSVADNQSFAMGDYASATGGGSFAMGNYAMANYYNAFAMGYWASAGENAFAFGYGASAQGGAIAMGASASGSGYSSVAFGYNAQAVGNYSFAVGRLAKAQQESSIAIGYLADAKYAGNVAIGYRALASAWSSVGQDNKYLNAVAIGSDVEAAGWGSLAIGVNSRSVGGESLVIGNRSWTMGNSSLAVGWEAKAYGDGGVSVGPQTWSAFIGTAVGASAVAAAERSAAFGNKTWAQGMGQTALGMSNAIVGDATNPTNPQSEILVVGSGYEDNRSNAMTLKRNGDLSVTGKIRVWESGDLSMGDFKAGPQPIGTNPNP